MDDNYEPYDEDNLGFTDTGAQSVGAPLELAEPVKRPRGRPRGYPKTGGRVKSPIAAAVIKRLEQIASGEKVTLRGPTGKLVPTFPSLSEQLRAAEVLAGLVPDVQAIAAPTPEPAKPVEADPDELRRALLENVLASLPPPPAPAADDIAPKVDPADGGTVISISDPAEIAKFDAKLRSGGNAKSKADANTRKFATGFYWEKKFDPTISQTVFDLFNPQGDHCGVRKTEERANRWCELEGACT